MNPGFVAWFAFKSDPSRVISPQMTWLNVWIKNSTYHVYFTIKVKDSNRISLQEIMDPCIQQTATCCFSMLFHSHPSISDKIHRWKKGCCVFFLTNLTNTLKSEIRSMWEINFPFKVWHEWPSFLLRIRNISRFTLESHEAGVSISWDNAWCICFWLDEIRRKFIWHWFSENISDRRIQIIWNY